MQDLGDHLANFCLLLSNCTQEGGDCVQGSYVLVQGSS